MKNPLIVVLIVAAVAVGAAVGLSLLWQERETNGSPERIVSLMPPVTETLYEIGAGDQLVGRSDWCNYPASARDLPPCGSALTPNLEVVTRLKPTLILANSSEATARADLRGIGHAEFLPWLSAEEMVESIRKLGKLTGHVEEANELADELSVVLLRPEPAAGPRVLLVMMTGTGRLEPITFLRRNSLHGQMLHAAGGRNAVLEEVTGVPELSTERVIELDPDMIIVVSIQDDLPESERAAIIDKWQRLKPLTAVREGRVGVLHGTHFYGAGRRLLRAVDELTAEIERLSHEQP